jgi:hypothetical protein
VSCRNDSIIVVAPYRLLAHAGLLSLDLNFQKSGSGIFAPAFIPQSELRNSILLARHIAKRVPALSLRA